MRIPAIDCPEVQERLPLFVGEDLDPQAHAAVLAHLERCAPCRGQEERARRARESLRAVLDESLRHCARPGLWPELRARLAREGLLASPERPDRTERKGRPARQEEELPTAPATGAARRALVAAGPAPATRALRAPRFLAPLAAAAVVLITLVASDPFGGAASDVSGPGATATSPSGARPALLSAAPGVSTEPVGLRRVGADEPTLLQDAQPLLRQGLPRDRRPAPFPDTTLVHYR